MAHSFAAGRLPPAAGRSSQHPLTLVFRPGLRVADDGADPVQRGARPVDKPNSAALVGTSTSLHASATPARAPAER